ncbi:hypothetical protein [Spongiibacter marinus]|uniref:hypothetical protein n=1 Tax=Spongiibacter marinus TaxID=354246 RepID=UPI0019614A76|nr:hypothetical protein [Spongiibacter marinus]MBM7424541.1 hypothetical protein [Spongiibacter marinus]MEE2652403.1 hypothetical protein [Pseudomonadota bacterium]
MKATASLFALLLTIYLSESNMIREKYQPVFGGILIIATAYWLLRAKEFVVLVLFCTGIGIASSGSLHDFLQESESFLALVPSSITSFILSFNEESIDTLGIGVICLSVAFLAPQPLSKLVDKGWGYFFLVVIAASIVAIGNGLAHYQYDPSTELLIVSSLLSLMGLSIYYILDNAVKDEHFKHVVENKKILYVATIYLFFVLPVLWADYNNFTAVSFWLLSIYLGKKMYEKSLKAI